MGRHPRRVKRDVGEPHWGRGVPSTLCQFALPSPRPPAVWLFLSSGHSVCSPAPSPLTRPLCMDPPSPVRLPAPLTRELSVPVDEAHTVAAARGNIHHLQQGFRV